MSRSITYLLLLFIAIWGLWAIVESLIDRSPRRLAIHATALIGVVVILRLTAGFPAVRESFGASDIVSVAVMFASVLAGIGARYVFYGRGRFSWRSFGRPLVLSPIVLLPLLGSIQGSVALESLQLVSLACLAFQNGFFWPTVLDDAKKQVGQRSRRSGAAPSGVGEPRRAGEAAST